MKKRIWNKVVSIFTAILLVVGLVPNTTITALAAETNIVYVGGVALPEVLAVSLTPQQTKTAK